MGTTLRELIEVHAGGMLPGYELRALIPGGASTAFVLAKDIDVPMDFDSMLTVGSRLGTGTPLLLDDKTCPVGLTLNMMQFFAQESCGWCTPCREGLQWIVSLMEGFETGGAELSDLDLLGELDLGERLRQVLLRPRPGGHPAARVRASGSSATSSRRTWRTAGAPTDRAARTCRSCGGRRGERDGGRGDRVSATANGNGSDKLVTVEIDGRRFQVEGGRNMLDVSLSLGFDLPYFCWHPAMGSIGACRQCAVRQHWVGRDGRPAQRDRHGVHDARPPRARASSSTTPRRSGSARA